MGEAGQEKGWRKGGESRKEERGERKRGGRREKGWRGRKEGKGRKAEVRQVDGGPAQQRGKRSQAEPLAGGS